jgi:hypothetical protein
MLGLRPGSDWTDQIEEAGSLIFHVSGTVQEMLDAGGRPLLSNVSAVEQIRGWVERRETAMIYDLWEERDGENWSCHC